MRAVETLLNHDPSVSIPGNDWDADEPTHPDLLAALPMRALVYGAANGGAAVSL